jgi:hypothetical protein
MSTARAANTRELNTRARRGAPAVWRSIGKPFRVGSVALRCRRRGVRGFYATRAARNGSAGQLRPLDLRPVGWPTELAVGLAPVGRRYEDGASVSGSVDSPRGKAAIPSRLVPPFSRVRREIRPAESLRAGQVRGGGLLPESRGYERSAMYTTAMSDEGRALKPATTREIREPAYPPGAPLRSRQCSGNSGCSRNTRWSSVPEAATASHTRCSASS